MDEAEAKVFYDKAKQAFSYQKMTGDGIHVPYDFRFAGVNAAFENETGLRAVEVAGKKFSEVFVPDFGYTLDWVKEHEEALLCKVTEASLKSPRKETWFSIRLFEMQDSYYGAVFTDITREKMSEQDEEALSLVTTDMLCVFDTDWKFLKVNHAFASEFGYSGDELKGVSWITFVHGEDVSPALEAIREFRGKEILEGLSLRYRTRKDVFLSVEWFARRIHNRIYAVLKQAGDGVAIAASVSEETSIPVRIDELTGLYNRPFFMKIVETETKRAELYKEKISMLILEIEHMKTMNDTWGHPVADDIMYQIALVAGHAVRRSDFAAHLGGDEIVLLLPQTNSIGATAAADKIRKVLVGNIKPATGKISVSIGLSDRMPFERIEDWYRRTDDALFQARDRGHNCIVAAKDMIEPKPETEDQDADILPESGDPELDEMRESLSRSCGELVRMAYTEYTFENAVEALGKIMTGAAELFAYEEELLGRLKYSEYRQHIKIHQKLTGKLSFLKSSFESQGLKSPAFFRFFAIEIMKGHILADDSKYEAFLREKRV
jgi:diguanylate cyclase (GGDEF)-like protein/PAS domain S-box-containing protein